MARSVVSSNRALGARDVWRQAESFAAAVIPASTTGEALTRVILDVLSRYNLPIAKLRAQCYDGASNMSGCFKGVQARIKELQPRALYVHCTAHSLNLALQETTSEVSVVRDSLHYLNDAAVLFGKSAKRKAILEEAQGRIKSLCPTRWTMRSAGIDVALQNYGAILDALQDVASQPGADDSLTKSRGLLEQFSSCRMYWSLCVAQRIFGPTERLSKVLQSSAMTVNGALSAVKTTYDFLVEQRSDVAFDEVMQLVKKGEEQFQIEPLKAPRTRRPPHSLDAGSQPVELTVIGYYRQQYFQLLDRVTTCLRDRFMDNSDMEIYRSLEELLLAKTVPFSGTEDVTVPASNALVYGDLDTSSLMLEKKMMKTVIDKGAMANFDSLSTLVQALRDKPPEVRMLFPETVKLANLLLVVPATSATAERSFSCLRRIKTWVNSTVSQSRLNSIAILHCYSELTPDLESVMCDFVGLNDIRRRFFGSCTFTS